MLKGCFRERVRASYFIFQVGALKAADKQITRQLTLHWITKIFPLNGITFLDLIFLACLYPAEFYIKLNIKDDLRLRAFGGTCAWNKYYDTNENTLLSFTRRMSKSTSLICQRPPLRERKFWIHVHSVHCTVCNLSTHSCRWKGSTYIEDAEVESWNHWHFDSMVWWALMLSIHNFEQYWYWLVVN